MSEISKKWTPANWASWKPFGIGEQRPNNFAEIFRAIAENRDELPFAWRILSQGVCDGCALGTTGLHDWTLDGVHLCNIRLRLLRLNTMGPFDTNLLAGVFPLEAYTSAELRELGRIPWPMIRRRGEPGFSRLSWNEALNFVAERMRTTTPERLGFYLTSRGVPNEAYYCAQKAARAIGTNNIDNAARVCHSPSTVALKEAIGVGATTCSYSDWLSAQVIVFIGSNVANNQPVATKYLHYAKKNGAQILVVNPYREPGMERYWIPSVPESALFGTKLAERFYQIRTGGDVAFLNGVLKRLIETREIDTDFIDAHTSSFGEVRLALGETPWEKIEAGSGLGRAEIFDLADRLARAERAVFVWSMGITQHVCGVDNVRAIINLALSRGFIGREGCGLMPIRGHSGVQGGAEMGAYATAFPGGLPVNAENAGALSAAWGFEVPAAPGLSAPEMIDAGARSELDVLFSAGGNFLEILPEPDAVERGIREIPVRVHMDLVLNSQMFVEPKDAVVLLPAATRYESPGGVTETTTERRIVYSPEIAGRRIAEARPEWEVFLDLAARVRPDRAAALDLPDTYSVREEIAKVVPMYEGIQRLTKQGDQFQYGGAHLCAGGEFPLPESRARFAAVRFEVSQRAPDEFTLTTRRGKQFNTMIHEERDALTGAKRDAVFMNANDAARLGLRDGGRVRLQSSTGTYEGSIRIAEISPGDVQVHWPEGNVLLDRTRRAPKAGIPDYGTTVRIERA